MLVDDVVSTRCLVDFGVEDSHENYRGYAHDGECTESKVPENPEITAWTKIHIGIEKADTAGDE